MNLHRGRVTDGLGDEIFDFVNLSLDLGHRVLVPCKVLLQTDAA